MEKANGGIKCFYWIFLVEGQVEAKSRIKNGAGRDENRRAVFLSLIHLAQCLISTNMDTHIPKTQTGAHIQIHRSQT